MVLFRSEQQRLVEAGEVRVTYRAWQAPRVRVGERYRLGSGSILIEACDPVLAASISDDDALSAGYGSRDLLIKAAAKGRPAELAYPDTLYRVAFRYEAVAARPGPEIERLTADDAALLIKRLDAMDARSGHGPWTRQTLRLIAAQPATAAKHLAAKAGMERLAFKTEVRRLKVLGLTISLGTGYELSPRGQALLDLIDSELP